MTPPAKLREGDRAGGLSATRSPSARRTVRLAATGAVAQRAATSAAGPPSQPTRAVGSTTRSAFALAASIRCCIPASMAARLAGLVCCRLAVAGGFLRILHRNLAAGRWIRPVSEYAGSVLLLETSEEMPPAEEVYRMLRNAGELGLREQFPAILVGAAKAANLEVRPTRQERARFRPAGGGAAGTGCLPPAGDGGLRRRVRPHLAAARPAVRRPDRHRRPGPGGSSRISKQILTYGLG